MATAFYLWVLLLHGHLLLIHQLLVQVNSEKQCLAEHVSLTFVDGISLKIRLSINIYGTAAHNM